ncbi:MAG TPA: LysM peptidoglycan-binding domain-containing protein [Burkholderiales bacterium]|nr:LysM peptidoglycan-binding domain-containing protein [Burkholderiales bacterium]
MRKTILSLILLTAFIGAANAAVSQKDLQKDAPERYSIVKGDTLWGISKRYLKDPWKWPELWGMNREQIRNPHLIYPGQVLTLDKRADGTAQLKASPTTQTVKLEPHARVLPSGREALGIVPHGLIEPFLSKPLVVSADEFNSAPLIVGGWDDRVVFGSGDTVYASGLTPQHGESQHIYRRGRALVDPDTQELLGYEAIYLGDAKVTRGGEVSTLDVVYANQEIHRSDRLTPSPGLIITSYAPRPPEKPVKGRIMAAYGGLMEMGQYSILTINRGTKDGLEVGHVLAVFSDGGRSQVGEKVYKLPGERIGLVLVFRTFDRVSYALVAESSRSIHVNDVVAKP